MSRAADHTQLVMQVTLGRDEGPDLFDLLMSIGVAKRRSARLKELAKLGLLIGRPGAAASLPVLRPGGQPAATPASTNDGVKGDRFTAAMLDWGGEDDLPAGGR